MNPDDTTPARGVPHAAGEALTKEATPSGDDAPLAVTGEDLALFDAYHHALGVAIAESDTPLTKDEQAALDQLTADTLETMSKSPEQVRAERRRPRR